jgi:hypothetical protein
LEVDLERMDPYWSYNIARSLTVLEQQDDSWARKSETPSSDNMCNLLFRKPLPNSRRIVPIEGPTAKATELHDYLERLTAEDSERRKRLDGLKAEDSGRRSHLERLVAEGSERRDKVKHIIAEVTELRNHLGEEFLHLHELDCIPDDRPQMLPDDCFFAKWSRPVLQTAAQRKVELRIESGRPYDKDTLEDPDKIGLDHKRYSRSGGVYRQYDSLQPSPSASDEAPQRAAAYECVSCYFKEVGVGFLGNQYP